MSKLLILALCLSLVAMGLACANAPQASIDEAKNALEAAREAGAEEYAPEAWQGAQDALTSAMTEVEAQNERFALLRRTMRLSNSSKKRSRPRAQPPPKRQRPVRGRALKPRG